MDKIVSHCGTDKMESCDLGITNCGMAIFTFEMAGDADDRKVVMDRKHAEALCDMIEDSYRRHDGTDSNSKADTEER